MSLTPPERETVVNASDGDPLVRIWTAQGTVITKLRKDPAFTELKTGRHDGTEWAEFTIPAEKFNLAKCVTRTRNLTEAQRAELSERMRATQAKRGTE